MKKSIFVLAFLLTACVLFAQTPKTGLKGNIGISLYGGANIPSSGNISSDITTSELLNPGPHFALGVSYFFTKNIGVEALFTADVNIYNDKYKADGKQPSIHSNSTLLNGIYNFGHLSGRSRIAPYVKAGIGVYHWRHLDDTPWRQGEVVSVNGIELKASSFGVNIGVGGDYSVSKNFVIGLEVDYNMYFPKDEEKFGKDFGTQGYFTPTLKLGYYLPVN